jgi:hypothetical protein
MEILATMGQLCTERAPESKNPSNIFMRKSTLAIILLILLSLYDELEIDHDLEREIKYSTTI